MPEKLQCVEELTPCSESSPMRLSMATKELAACCISAAAVSKADAPPCIADKSWSC